MINEILNLIPSVLAILFNFYGCFSFLTELFVNIIPIGIFLTVILVFLIYGFRAPAPPSDIVEAIIGKDLLDNEDQEGYVLKTVAHRGAGLDAPENSLAAFELCKTGGCDFIEFDVTLTSDGQPVVFHDSTLERMADSELIINNTNWETLRSIDISIKHPYRERFGTTHISTLEETVAAILNNDQKMFIDIKDDNSKLVPVIHALFEKYPDLYSKAIVSSFFPQIIYFLRKSNPKIVCSLAYRPNSFANEYYRYPEGKGPQRAVTIWKHWLLVALDSFHKWALPRITYYLLGISVILLHKDCISPESILNWRSKGVRVMAWTVNAPTEKQYITRILKITYLTDTLTGENSIHHS